MHRFVEEFNPEPADVAICASMSHIDHCNEIADKLEAAGLSCHLPDQVEFRDWSQKNDQEIADLKGELVRRHFANIAVSSCVLVVNDEKNKQENYIGANTFMEMTAAFIQNKPIYTLNPLPDSSNRDELLTMRPIVLNGDIEKLINDMKEN